jgi:glycyl-tRNA synthetase
MEKTDRIEDIAKRRGFFWISSEIHGGLSGFYDYAHLGFMIKRKWENLWRSYYLGLDDNFYEIDACNIMPEAVFQASGHLESFVDPVARCKKCGTVERADHLLERELHDKDAPRDFEGMTSEQMSELVKRHDVKCAKCGSRLENVGILNMMFPLTIGSNTTAYLRPETAQSPYVNFRREFECLRKKLPLGLAVIGRAYRNEISPRNSLIRMREFTQAELQIFFNPDRINEHPKFDEIAGYKLMLYPVENRKSGMITEMSCRDVVEKLKIPKFYVYHMAIVQKFYLEVIKIDRNKFRYRQLADEEKAFYNKYHWDIELDLESLGGFKEVGGIHYRTDHDLGGHQKVSKQDMGVFIDDKKFVPHVLELSFGVDRNLYALFDLGLAEEKERTIFKFPRKLSPHHCAIFPLVNKDGIPEKSEVIFQNLKKMGFDVFFDDSGSIGRRYRRMDEIGVAACITIDHQTLKDGTVTLRDRDTMEQKRIHENELCTELHKFLNE